MEKTKLFYIGDQFYLKSNSIMSSIYEQGSRNRYDWGFVERDLRQGKTIIIRPATKEEMSLACERLCELTMNK